MHVLITTLKNGAPSSSVIVDKQDLHKAEEAFRSKGIDYSFENFQTYEDAFKVKFEKDYKLLRSPVMFESRFAEAVLSVAFGNPKLFIERNLRFGYELAEKALSGLIEEAEAVGAIKSRRISEDLDVLASGDTVSVKTVIVDVDVNQLNGFDFEEFEKYQSAADGLQYLLFDISMDEDVGVLTLESFVENLYQQKDNVDIQKLDLGNPYKSILAGFNFENSGFFKRMLGVE